MEPGATLHLRPSNTASFLSPGSRPSSRGAGPSPTEVDSPARVPSPFTISFSEIVKRRTANDGNLDPPASANRVQARAAAPAMPASSSAPVDHSPGPQVLSATNGIQSDSRSSSQVHAEQSPLGAPPELQRFGSPEVGGPGEVGLTRPGEGAHSAASLASIRAGKESAYSTPESMLQEGPPHRIIRLVPHLGEEKSLDFDPIIRECREGGPSIIIGRKSQKLASRTNLLLNTIGFRSKVVSRNHAELWCEPHAKFYIKDTSSSGGTFLNDIRLSKSGVESPSFGLSDGDILQLGVNYQGGLEAVYRCARMRVEIETTRPIGQADGRSETEGPSLVSLSPKPEIFSPLVPVPTEVTIDQPGNINTANSEQSAEDTDITSVIEHEIPNLAGQVWKSQTGTVILGTYSTVYPGIFGDKKVAIKVLRMAKDTDTTQRRFRRELYIWWNLRHINVLPLYGYFVANDGGHIFPCLVSEWAEGGSAAQYIDRDLSWEQRTVLVGKFVKDVDAVVHSPYVQFHNVAEGLNYLHGFTPLIVHADLKPQNILVDENGVGQLCDFGLTRFMQDGLETGLTTTTAYTGTTRYLAYELVDYEDRAIPTTATDIYALGCIGLEFIYRVPPHASLGMNQGKITRAIGDGRPPATRPQPSEDAVSLLWDLLETCWSPNPDDRPTASQAYTYLEENLLALSESLGEDQERHKRSVPP